MYTYVKYQEPKMISSFKSKISSYNPMASTSVTTRRVYDRIEGSSDKVNVIQQPGIVSSPQAQKASRRMSEEYALSSEASVAYFSLK